MADNNEDKIKLSELDDNSKIILEHYVEKSVKTLIDKYRWILIILGALLSVILFLIFIDYFKLRNVVAEEKKNLNIVKSLKGELELDIKSLNDKIKAFDEHERRNDLFNNKQEALLNSNIDYYNQRIRDVNNKLTTISNVQEKSIQLIDSGKILQESLLHLSQDLYDKGVMVDRSISSMSIKLDNIDSIQEQFKAEFSSVYAFVERGKKREIEKSKNDYDRYRPFYLQLPFSNEVLKVIFHRQEYDKRTGDKIAYLDFYHNDSSNYFISGAYKEGDVINIPESRFKLVILQIYLANPVFVYGYIPDFVTIRAYYK